jgi:MFS family permease
MGNESRFGPSHRWRVLAIGVAANASFAAALAGIPTTAVFMRSGYRLDTRHLGFVLSAMGLGVAVSEVPWGLVTDRLGDRRVLLAGLAMTGAVLALMALFVSPAEGYVPAVTLLGLGLLFVGAIGGSLNGSSGRAVMAWFQESERGFAMSVRQMALPAGGALGALILPTIAERLGFGAVYGTIAAFCFVTTAFAWAWLHEPPMRAAATPGNPSATTSQSGRGLFGNGELWRMVWGLGALCVPQIAAVTFAAVFLHDVGHLGTAAISGSIVAFQVGAALTRVWSGRFTDRHKNRRPFLRACALLIAAIFGLLGLLVGLASVSPSYAGPAIAAAVALIVLGGIVAQTWHGIAYTELATIAGAKHVATALGLGNTFVFVIYFFTPLSVPLILQVSAWKGVWLTAAAAAALAFVLFPKSAPVEQKDPMARPRRSSRKPRTS